MPIAILMSRTTLRIAPARVFRCVEKSLQRGGDPRVPLERMGSEGEEVRVLPELHIAVVLFPCSQS